MSHNKWGSPRDKQISAQGSYWHNWEEDEPEIRIFSNLLFFGVVLSIGWFLALVLRGRDASIKLVTALLAVSTVLSAPLIVAALSY